MWGQVVGDGGRVEAVVRTVVSLLAERKYGELEVMTRSRLYTAHDIADAVSRYAETIVIPPDQAFEDLDIVRTADAEPTFDVDFRLWTVESGRSSISLSLLVTEFPDGDMDVILANIVTR
jgi:hypothetical protein